MNRHGPFPWRNWQANEARALTICANWRTLFLSMNSAASKMITRKSMKRSSKKVLAAKVRRRAVPAEEKNVADRVVESIVTGLNTFRRTGKFPKVY
jgi:hypothetical protein